MNIRRQVFISRLVLLLFAVGGGAGCVNLEAVRQFSKTSAATADNGQIVADYSESPIRRQRYAGPNAAADLRATAAKRGEYRERIQAVQAILVKYLSTIADAAAGDLPNADSEIESLTKALTGIRFVGEADAISKNETASAASEIAKVVTRLVLDGWRQRELKSLIQKTDNDIQAVVNGLREIIEKDYLQALESEAVQIKKPFEGWSAAARSAGDRDGAPTVAGILVEERLAELDKRRNAALQYSKALKTIGKGHREIATQGLELDSASLKALLQEHSKNLQALYKSIQTLSR